MPCDSGGNCDSFNAVVGAFQSLRARCEPGYVICGGYFNVDLSRVQSSQTVMFKNFCCSEGLISAHTIGNPVEYTYCGDISGIKSTIDHFVISIELPDSINKHSILDELENKSVHLPLCIEITLPVS